LVCSEKKFIKMKVTPDQFFDAYAVPAQNACKGSGFFPSVMLGQAAIESGWNGTELSSQANNFFGIKDSDTWEGDTVTFPTPKDPTPTSVFRKYQDAQESFEDRNKFLTVNKFYKDVCSAATPEEQALALENSPYSGDPQYGVHIMEIVNAHGLTQYDSE
jgi:flagellum-specific peptidoglycan hydrolase FlgJ